MAHSSHDFQASTVNWRESLQRNKRRTRYVIGTFILIYLAIGLLVDLYIQTGHYPKAPLGAIFDALVTFQITPIATIIVSLVAVISVLVTFKLYDRIMLLGTQYHEITAKASSEEERRLYNVVEEMKIAAGMHYMPKVFIIDADYMNAFASGYSEKSSMVAITRGLVQKLNRNELCAVMAHELSHIRHMDIKLTLVASVLTNITLIIVDVLFFTALFGGRGGDDDRGRNQLFWVILIIRYLLPVLTVLLMLYLSRTREYMADAGCVELMRDNEALASALLKIQQDHTDHQEQYAQAYKKTPHEAVRREAYIFDPIQQGISSISSPSDMFSTHPGIVKRLAAIGVKLKKE
jgi:heat shock protein HtpX